MRNETVLGNEMKREYNDVETHCYASLHSVIWIMDDLVRAASWASPAGCAGRRGLLLLLLVAHLLLGCVYGLVGLFFGGVGCAL